MARARDSLWSELPPGALTQLEELEADPEVHRMMAEWFRQMGRRVGGEPSPEVRDYLARHP